MNLCILFHMIAMSFKGFNIRNNTFCMVFPIKFDNIQANSLYINIMNLYIEFHIIPMLFKVSLISYYSFYGV